MGMLLGLIFLAGVLASFLVMIVTLILQRFLRKKKRGISWAKFFLAALVVTLFFGLILVALIRLTERPGEPDYEAWVLNAFLFGISPGLGFLSAYIFSLAKSVD
jgi:hypothetical protein